jgi:ribonuclease HI
MVSLFGCDYITAIISNELQGASDGSWIETQGIGTWGYVLATSLNDIQTGSGNCMLHDATNAQTAEHYGALGVLSSLLHMARAHSVSENDCAGKYIILWIDNAEVQRRFNVKPNALKVGTFVLADMELWYKIHEIKNLLPFKVISRWVKGHQDRQAKFEDLEFNAQLNI